jgi:hypothetical protein
MQQKDKTLNQDEEYEKLKASKFKQQKLPAWRPVPTITSTTITFVAFGVVFIVIGIVVLVYSKKTVEISYRYDEECQNSSNNICEIKLTIPKTMQQPIMMYYQLDNFYQNHRRYVKSKSDLQLDGDYISLKKIKDSGDCEPVETNQEMEKNKSISGLELDPNEVAVPCGLIAKSFFNDTYQLKNEKGEQITIDESNIAWEADKKLKYKNVKDPNGKDKEFYKKVQWIDMTNEHFIVWMRPAGLPNFRKLWGRIRDDLPEGEYTVKIEDNFKVSAFKGRKHIVLSTVNAFGGKNTFLGVSYVVVGGICIVLALIFLIGYQIHQRKEK